MRFSPNVCILPYNENKNDARSFCTLGFEVADTSSKAFSSYYICQKLRSCFRLILQAFEQFTIMNIIWVQNNPACNKLIFQAVEIFTYTHFSVRFASTSSNHYRRYYADFLQSLFYSIKENNHYSSLYVNLSATALISHHNYEFTIINYLLSERFPYLKKSWRWHTFRHWITWLSLWGTFWMNRRITSLHCYCKYLGETFVFCYSRN